MKNAGALLDTLDAEYILEMDPKEAKSFLIGGILGFAMGIELKDVETELAEYRKLKPKAKKPDYYKCKSRCEEIKRRLEKEDPKYEVKLLFDNLQEANNVIDEFQEVLEKEGQVSVKELYDIAAISNYDEKAEEWGWDSEYDLENLFIDFDHGRFKIEMPYPKKLAKKTSP